MRRTALACAVLTALAALANAGEGPGFPYDPKAIPELVEQLKDKKGHVRDLARDNLILLGDLALPAVVPAMKDPDKGLRSRAVYIIGEMGPAAQGAIGDLLEAAKANNFEQLYAAMGALLKIGPASVPALTAALSDADWRVKEQAALALGKLGLPTKPVLNALSLALRDGNAKVRAAAAGALASFGSDAAPAVRELAEATKRPGTAEPAIAALGAIGPAARSALAPIMKFVRTGGRETARITSGGALARIVPGNQEGLAVIVKFLKHPNVQHRRLAARTMGDVGAPAKPAARFLIAALGDKDAQVRRNAADALVRIGAGTKEVLAAVTPELDDRSYMVAQRAIDLIARIGPSAIPDMLKLAAGKDARRRRRAMEAISRMGPAAKPALGDLVKYLSNKDSWIATYAARTIAAIGPEARGAAAGEILRALDSHPKHAPPWMSLVSALAKIDPANPRLPEYLKRALERHKGWKARQAAADCVAAVGPAAAETAPLLKPMLADARYSMRLAAAGAFAEMGIDAERVSIPEAAPPAPPKPESESGTKPGGETSIESF